MKFYGNKKKLLYDRESIYSLEDYKNAYEEFKKNKKILADIQYLGNKNGEPFLYFERHKNFEEFINIKQNYSTIIYKIYEVEETDKYNDIWSEKFGSI